MINKSIGLLFIVLLVILAINPKIVNNMYETILGRLLLIGVVIFFATNNTTLGLLIALVIITSLNQFGSFTEGMDNMQLPTTIGEDNVDETGTQSLLTRSASKKKISEIKEDVVQGVDKEDIKAAIMAKDSKTIPVDPQMTGSTDVSAATSGMLSDSKLEGFQSYASVMSY
jgi:hypothetical protein